MKTGNGMAMSAATGLLLYAVTVSGAAYPDKPLRWVVRDSEAVPYSAPQTASASALSRALRMVWSR